MNAISGAVGRGSWLSLKLSMARRSGPSLSNALVHLQQHPLGVLGARVAFLDEHWSAEVILFMAGSSVFESRRRNSFCQRLLLTWPTRARHFVPAFQMSEFVHSAGHVEPLLVFRSSRNRRCTPKPWACSTSSFAASTYLSIEIRSGRRGSTGGRRERRRVTTGRADPRTTHGPCRCPARAVVPGSECPGPRSPRAPWAGPPPACPRAGR